MPKINYYGDYKIQIIELPYEDNHLSMVIILPNKNNYNSPLNFMKNEKNDVIKCSLFQIRLEKKI